MATAAEIQIHTAYDKSRITLMVTPNDTHTCSYHAHKKIYIYINTLKSLHMHADSHKMSKTFTSWIMCRYELDQVANGSKILHMKYFE